MIAEPKIQVHENEYSSVGTLPERVSYEEFLRLCDGQHAEWIGDEDGLGEISLMPHIGLSHAEVSGFLTVLLALYVEDHQLGRVLTEPFLMKLPVAQRGRLPDIFFVSRENISRLTQSYLEGPADLCVEIISRESRLRDRGEKFAEYEIEGVREYWLIDPELREEDFFVLNARGRYDRVLPDENGFYDSRVLTGLRLNVNWLRQRPLPKLRDALREIGL